jgi:bifunctional DNA-binding transcriptional regulator/antitoxin component of YhaV-PrlF toxin-antitoxin module
LIVDAAGRLQIPISVREEAKLGARVRVRVENGRMIIENADDA